MAEDQLRPSILNRVLFSCIKGEREMVQVKVTQDYFDREQDKLMNVDDQFECSQERAEILTIKPYRFLLKFR